jgi:DNA-binding transcriptional ArsR family regulator
LRAAVKAQNHKGSGLLHGGASLIRIHLTAEDIARVRIAAAPDLDTELVWAGWQLANGYRTSRLTQWRHALTRGWKPDTARLFDLYSATSMPGFAGTVQPEPGATAKAVATTDPDGMGYYLRILTRARPMTPFLRTLAAGRDSAYTALGEAVANLQTVALQPYRRTIAAQVAAAAAQAGARAASSGVGAMLNTLHPQISWDGRVLGMVSRGESDLELDGRVLVVRPSALAVKPGHSGIMFADTLEVYYPATEAALVPDPRPGSADPALVALLGSTRAAVLDGVVRSPAITTGQLAERLGVSAAAVSRHTATLRDAGLISTLRDAMSVHHHPTTLGIDLADVLNRRGANR